MASPFCPPAGIGPLAASHPAFEINDLPQEVYEVIHRFNNEINDLPQEAYEVIHRFKNEINDLPQEVYEIIHRFNNEINDLPQEVYEVIIAMLQICKNPIQGINF